MKFRHLIFTCPYCALLLTLTTCHCREDCPGGYLSIRLLDDKGVPILGSDQANDSIFSLDSLTLYLDNIPQRTLPPMYYGYQNGRLGFQYGRYNRILFEYSCGAMDTLDLQVNLEEVRCCGNSYNIASGHVVERYTGDTTFQKTDELVYEVVLRKSITTCVQ